MTLNRSTLLALSAGILVAIALPVTAVQVGSYFSDVQLQEYYGAAVSRMSRLGIIRGYSNGRFGPNDGVTRGQIAVLLQRYDETAIEPLRIQIAELRKKAGLGECGDGKQQSGEQCDDGNKNDSDGCSRECLKESAGGPVAGLCEGRYQIGESYPSTDGCNTCTCTQNGSACTLRACNTCQPIVCSDGRQYPSCTQNGSPINYFADPCLVPGGSSSRSSSSVSSSRSSSSSSVATSCEVEKNDFRNTVAGNRSCTVDSDCTLFIASCPYLTCGEAVRKDSINKMEDSADAYFVCKQRSGDAMACAGCAQQRAVCQAGLCTVK